MPPNKEAREAIAVAVFATVLATFVAYRVFTPDAPPTPPTVRPAPEPAPTPDPGFDPEVWRLRNCGDSATSPSASSSGTTCGLSASVTRP
jgi:hypothetical protein